MSCYRDLNPGPLPYQGSALPLSYNSNWRDKSSGQRWIRTTEGISQQIYSLPHLATLVFALIKPALDTFFEPLVGFEPTTPRLQITCSGQLS